MVRSWGLVRDGSGAVQPSAGSSHGITMSSAGSLGGRAGGPTSLTVNDGPSNVPTTWYSPSMSPGYAWSAGYRCSPLTRLQSQFVMGTVPQGEGGSGSVRPPR